MKKYLLIAVAVLLAALVVLLLRFGSPSPSIQSTDADTGKGTIVEGVHYRKVALEITATEEIQVQEFFWYGCPHCQRFEPEIRNYKKTLPDDVKLVQVPVTWNEATGLHAAMHYVAMESDDLENLQDSLFEKIISIRQEGNLEKHIEVLAPIFAAHGISETDYREKLNSSGVKARVSAAAEMMRAADITGTPSLMVDGTWVVLNNEEVSKAGFFNVADHLIAMAREARESN